MTSVRTLTEITEPKRAEEELRPTRARIDYLLGASPAAIYSARLADGFALTFVSETVTRQLGYRGEEVLDDPAFWAAHLHPEDASRVLAALVALGDAAAETERQSQQYRFRHRDGTYRWIHDERRLVRDPAGAPLEIVGSWVDITGHWRAEDERARLSSVVEQSAEAIIITTPDGIIEYVNPACERLTGYRRAELIGRTPRILKSGQADAEFFRSMWATLWRGNPWSGRFVNRRKDGSLFEVEAVISPVRDAAGQLISYVGGLRDVTHEREMEDQLRQAQKMETAGRLAGGVAHDFNNLLTVITGRTYLLLHELGLDDPRRRELELIQETAQRAAALTRQLLMFSRKQVVAPSVLDLNAVVANMEKMLRRLIGEDIELVTRPGEDLGRVTADPGQLEQVIMNLAVNARDAMPRGGRLTIETANVELDEAYARRHLEVRPGPYVMLGASDTGCGIDPATKAHIFEPFFTTKASDKGTGLGLSTVYGIVKQSGGQIEVESEVGRGTTFRICLPRVDGVARPGESGPARVPLPRGSETVLLAEDEDEVRALTRESLRMSGYTVLEARHGAEALEVAARHPGPIPLLLTDVVMPQMGGGELAEALARLRPDTRVLYMSGYTNDNIVHQRVAAAGLALIEKPFTPADLARKVREVLDAPRGGP